MVSVGRITTGVFGQADLVSGLAGGQALCLGPLGIAWCLDLQGFDYVPGTTGVGLASESWGLAQG